MKITELISDFNSLFSYFVPGAICVWVYTRLSMKKIEYAAYVIISISLGYLFKNFVDGYAPQCLITVVPSALLYVALGFICGILFYLIKNSFPARKFFAHFLSVETADNIWTKFFDTKRGTKILVFTKDGKVIYGKLSSADDDYIVVIHHCKYATSAGTADSATTSNGVKDYNNANRTIKIGFAGAGLTSENLNYIAGYTDNGTKIKDVSKDVLKSWIGLGNYLPLIGGTMSGQITKSTGGFWIGDRDRAAIKSSYAGDSSYGAVAAMATKNGYWTMGNLGGNESLIFNYSTDAKYNAGKNETSQVYLPAQAGTIITSATIGSQSVNYANSAGTANVSNSVDWSKVQNKPSSYAPTSHTHDDRYYTESEVNTKLANYQPKGNYAAASHTHNYAGSGSTGGSANSAIKLDSSAGSATQPVYFKDGKPVATTYALNKTVPADAKFTDTNTWRGIQNNLTSDSTDQSLSAAQGKALKTLVDGKAPASHKHTKSQITDFPTSMPASDVSAWAKAATKLSYTKAEVGLGNVDNTADKNKSVNYATMAKTASTGLNGISSSGTNYVRFYNGTQICWMSQSSKVSSSTSITWTFQVPFKDNNYCFVYSHYRSATGRGITKTASTVTCDFSVILTECSMLAIGCWK